jgi:hypothetical protein
MQPFAKLRVFSDMTAANIGRKLPFFIGALVLMGSGCHPPTSPTNNTNDTIPLSLHY